MHPDSAAIVWDAQQAAQLVISFLAGVDLEAYVEDPLLTSAVERQLTIVGEALNRLSRVDPSTAAEVPELSRIVGFRNILVHGYTSIDSVLVWQLATTRLPQLIECLDQILRRAN